MAIRRRLLRVPSACTVPLAPVVMIAAALVAARVARGGVRALDPNASEPLSAQISRPSERPTTAPAAKQTLDAEVDAKIAVVEREVARLSALGEAAKARAGALAQRLGDIRDRRAHKAVVKDDQPELHVVGVYEGAHAEGAEKLPPAQRRRQLPVRGTAVVEVQATGRPIVLSLSAYEGVNWELRVAPDANITRIVIGGYHKQEVAGAPKDVPVDTFIFEGGAGEQFFYTYGPGSESHAQAITRLSAITGLEISTVQGVYRYPGQPFVIGPGNAEWVAQRLLSDLTPLYREARAFELAKQREAIGDVRFTAVRYPAAPFRGPNAPPPTLAEFTPRGPIEGTDRPLPPRTTQTAIDPADSTVYALEMHEVARVDPKTQRATRLTIDNADLPRMSWPSGAAFDTKRRRLVVCSYGGSGFLYAYDPVARKWSGLVDLENVDITSLVYSPAHDCFYALLRHFGEGGGTRLVRYTPEGDADQVIETSRPITGELRGPNGHPQLIAVGELLACLPTLPGVGPAARRARVAGELEPRATCFLIDPRTGDVKYAGPMEPHAGAAANELAEAGLDAAWAARSAENPAEADRAMSLLASGGNRTVAFLRRELTSPASVDPQRVREWLAQLDHADFNHRDTATRELRRLDRQVEPALRETLAARPSAEVVTRIEGLLRELQPDAEAKRKLDRDARAAELLARIGSPEAIEFLGELAAGPASAPRTADARRALQQFGRDG